MKPSLSKYSKLHLLKRNEKLLPNSIYIIGSESVARNFFFNQKKDLEIMHLKIKHHLSIVANVIDYVFTPYGFTLVIKTKSAKSIIENYSSLQKRKNKSIRFTDASRIISEQIRFAISAGVKKINIQNKRSGSLSHSNFFRFLAQEYNDIIIAINHLKNKVYALCRQNRRFRRKLNKWNINNLMFYKQGSLISSESDQSIFIKSIKLSKNYLEQIIRRTILSHFNDKKIPPE